MHAFLPWGAPCYEASSGHAPCRSSHHVLSMQQACDCLLQPHRAAASRRGQRQCLLAQRPRQAQSCQPHCTVGQRMVAKRTDRIFHLSDTRGHQAPAKRQLCVASDGWRQLGQLRGSRGGCSSIAPLAHLIHRPTSLAQEGTQLTAQRRALVQPPAAPRPQASSFPASTAAPSVSRSQSVCQLRGRDTKPLSCRSMQSSPLWQLPSLYRVYCCLSPPRVMSR